MIIIQDGIIMMDQPIELVNSTILFQIKKIKGKVILAKCKKDYMAENNLNMNDKYM